jgi:hypothetical protein
LLQRDKQRSDSKYLYKPKKFTREPLMMSDGDVVFSNAGVSLRHHILLMENLPSWNKFPKRSKSIIGSTGYQQKYMFQTLLFCNTFDGATLG